MSPRVFNYVLYELGWCACVLGAAWDHPWIGSALGVTDRTVRRHWERARLLLAEMLGR